jgi:hypothetical protein
MSATLAAIRRYPVKGLSGEALERAELAVGEGLPHDRRFALAHAASQFDRADPHWLPKQNFLQLMRDERLALLDARFDADDGYLTIFRDGRQVARGQVTEPLGRILIEQFLDAFIEPGPRGNPHIVEAPGVMLSDVPDKFVSIANLASIKDIERVARAPVDPRRFRANLHLDARGCRADQPLRRDRGQSRQQRPGPAPAQDPAAGIRPYRMRRLRTRGRRRHDRCRRCRGDPGLLTRNAAASGSCGRLNGEFPVKGGESTPTLPSPIKGEG